MVAEPIQPLLKVENLRKHFPVSRGQLSRRRGIVRAVDGVSLEIQEGKTLGLVGESGCGKTTLARCILGAIASTSGQIWFRASDGKVHDLAALSPRALRPLRSQIQMIFQNPFTSLNPRMTLLDIVGEPLLINARMNRAQRTDRVVELLELVGLRAEYLRRFPPRDQWRTAPANWHCPRLGAQPALGCRG